MPTIKLKWASTKATTDSSELALVVDILRASTVVTTLLKHGALSVTPVIGVREARRIAAQKNAVLAGERHSLPIKGFDLGFSPGRVRPDLVRGRAVVLTSTNFPLAVNAAQASPIIFAGSLLNVSHVTRTVVNLARTYGYDICFMLAGRKGGTSDEELAFSGLSAAIMQKESVEASPAVLEAISFVSRMGARQLIVGSEHARDLAARGFKEDVEYACQEDTTSLSPVLINSSFVPFSDAMRFDGL